MAKSKSKPKSKPKGKSAPGGKKKGKVGGGGGKGKGKKGKKSKKNKVKKEVTPVDIPIPEPDVYFWVRRKNTSILIETYEEQTLPDFRDMLAKILAQPVDAFTLFKDKVELVDVKKEPPNKKDKNDSRGGGFGGKSDSSKKKGGSKGGKTMSKKSDDSAGKEGSAEAPVIMRLVDYGISVSGSSIFNPATLALSMKDATTGAWEPVEITPWTKPAEIPDSVKPYLRNYTSVLNADNATTSADDMTPPPEKAQGKNNKKTSGGKEVGI